MTLPATFEERVRERIDVALSEFIPPEQLDKLVKARVQDVMQKELPQLIEREIRDKLTVEIKANLLKPELAAVWDSATNTSVSTLVEKVVIDSAPLILAKLIGSYSQQFIEQLKYSLPSPPTRY